jgi:carbon-monoxide dehydrogenase medium subunit
MGFVKEFEYFKPTGLTEAVSLLSSHQGAAILAGGTDLVVEIKEGLKAPDVVVDIKGLSELAGISFDGNVLRIGALVTFAQLLQSGVVRQHFPVLQEMAATVASGAVRNRATLAGNICSAVPCMNSGPVMCLYDARVTLSGPRGERTVAAHDWFTGVRRTAIQPAEILTAITFPVPAPRQGACFVKLGRYAGEDLAQVIVAVLVLPDHHCRVGFGAVATVPLRAPRIEALLQGKVPDETLIRAAQDLIDSEIKPITDIRASKEYRLHMAKIMFKRALTAAVQRFRGAGPAYGTPLI